MSRLTDIAAIEWLPSVVDAQVGGGSPGSFTFPPTPISTSTATKLSIEKVGNGYIIKEKGKKLLVFNDFYDMCNHMRGRFGEPDPNSEKDEYEDS